MRLSTVIDRFALISGLEAISVSKWTEVCKDALEEVKSKALTESLLDESKARRLTNYAAAVAYYRYCLYKRDEVHSFTAGSVSITENEDVIAKAEKLLETEHRAVAELMRNDGDFCFARVRI